MHDVFYIPIYKFKTLCLEPQNFELYAERKQSFEQADIEYVALLESLLRSDGIYELVLRFPRLEDLL